jgi:acetyl esterase/lipase
LRRKIFLYPFFLLVSIFALWLFFQTPPGRPVLKTLLLVPEVVPSFPVKPLQYFSRQPEIREVTLQISGKSVKADLYRPKDDKKHPAVVFTLGIVVMRKDAAVTKFAQALSRTGFVVLVPDLPDFLSGFVWTDSVETLISSVEFLDRQDFVDKARIGFAGFCVGASASIIAAENERINNKVTFISAISPYFDLTKLTEAVLTRQVRQGSTVLPWQPAELTVEAVQKGYLNYIADTTERNYLLALLKGKNTLAIEEKFPVISEDGQKIYSFLKNSNPENFEDLKANLPEGLKRLTVELSPSSNIANLHAKVFVLNDKKDTFVPEIEGENLSKNLPKNQVFFIDVDSFEHVNPKTRLERLAALKQLFQLGRYVYSIFSKLD